MTVEATAQTIRAYLDTFLARGDFADYFTDDVTWTTVGTGQELQGRQPVHDFLSWMHTQAFDAHPKVKTLIIADGQAALEADFVGTHTWRVPRHPAHRQVGPGPLLRDLRPARRQAGGPARLHPHGPVHPTTQLRVAVIAWQLARGGPHHGALEPSWWRRSSAAGDGCLGSRDNLPWWMHSSVRR